MGRDTGLANRLRDAGIPVVEVAGWQERGSSEFGPEVSVNHHTAGPSSGNVPSLNTVTYGRSDLPGPLCEVLQSRESGDGNDAAYVVAAGKANHAGEGGWKGVTGNSNAWGLEIEHTGVDPLHGHRQDTAAAIHAVMFSGDPSMVCQHREWAPSRKIDAAEGVDASDFREMVEDARRPGSAPAPPPKHLLSTAPFLALEEPMRMSISWWEGPPTKQAKDADENWGWFPTTKSAYLVIGCKDEITDLWFNVSATWIESYEDVDLLLALGMTDVRSGEWGAENKPLPVETWDCGLAFVNGPFKNT